MTYIVALGCALLAAIPSLAQTAADQPEFEVASVKPASPDSKYMKMRQVVAAPMREQMDRTACQGGPGSKDPVRFTCNAVTLKGLLLRAYALQPYQVAGPAWLEEEAYDIVAKVPPDTDQDRLRRMLQKLVTDRFGIVSHKEMRELPYYKLTVAKGGPKLQPPINEKTYATEEDRRAALDAARAKRTEALLARMRSEGTRAGSTMNGNNDTMAKLAEDLANQLGGPVRDMTGLEGEYSYQIFWTPESALVSAKPAEGAPDAPSIGQSIFTALQEQLGLKLEKTKGPFEVLVVDQAEKTPTGN